MIVRHNIPISSENDFYKIIDYIDSRYKGEKTVRNRETEREYKEIEEKKVLWLEEIKENVGTNCKMISVEFPYYEQDYLSSFYGIYAKKFQTFPKEGYRLLFYRDEEMCELMGYVTLRPTYEGREIGKIFLNPKYFLEGPAKMILGKCKCHTAGCESVFDFFPHMRQEGDVVVCGHVALWSVLRSYASRFHKYPELTVEDIAEMNEPHPERTISVRGMDITQIARILQDVGFSPAILHKQSNDDGLIREALISYILSGIPVIGILTKYEHATTVIGLGNKVQIDNDTRLPLTNFNSENGEQTANIVFDSRLYREVIVNDDNVFPYRVSGLSKNKSQVKYTIADIDRIIVPLPPKIRLTYENVRSMFLGLYVKKAAHWGDIKICRAFLASANTYREYVNEFCPEEKSELKTLLITLEMPRFIWVIETYTVLHYHEQIPQVDGLVIIDSTSAAVNPTPYLFIAYPDGNTEYRDGEKIIRQHLSSGFPIPFFDKNLRGVNYDAE